VSSSGRGVRPG